jgi:16S rRNA C967 or C1407 C5-methylase (RsmB/RsmF family)
MKQPTGKSAFEAYYHRLFPNQVEFDSFLQALTAHRLPILRFHPHNQTKLQALWQQQGIPFETLDWYPYAALWPKTIPYGQIIPGYTEHLFYPMNASSLLPVLSLDPQPGEYILDACAAPGGKALFISELLNTNTLVANDLSRARRDRMKTIFRNYNRDIAVWGMKAELICKKAPEAFDKILLDAPCSSEAHIYSNAEELAKWSENRVRGLKKRQVGLLGGVWHALKPGGRVVYSTCAITPEENEWVVGQFLKKKKGSAILETCDLRCPGITGFDGEYPTSFDLTHVRRVMPQHHNLDPMFVAVFRKSP